MHKLILWDTHYRRKRTRRGYCNCNKPEIDPNNQDAYGYIDVVLDAPRCKKCGSLITIRSRENNFNKSYRFQFLTLIPGTMKTLQLGLAINKQEPPKQKFSFVFNVDFPTFFKGLPSLFR